MAPCCAGRGRGRSDCRLYVVEGAGQADDVSSRNHRLDVDVDQYGGPFDGQTVTDPVCICHAVHVADQADNDSDCSFVEPGSKADRAGGCTDDR